MRNAPIHGHAMGGKSKEYAAWLNMKSRCLNPNTPEYKRYGGRGIGIHQPWINSFQSFLSDVGICPDPSYSLDRFPNGDGNYEPGNVRWATKVEQMRNRKCNKLDEHDARFIRHWKSAGYRTVDICRAFGLHKSTVRLVLIGAIWRDVQ